MKHWQGWAAMLLLWGSPIPEVAAKPMVRDFGFPELPVVAQGNGEERKAQADRLYSEAFDLWDADRFQEAIDKFQQALAIYREVGSRGEEGKTLHYLGDIYNNLAEYTQALDYYQPALSIAREVGNRDEEGKILNHLGRVYENLEQYLEALENYLQALVIAREVGNRSGEGRTLSRLGVVYYNLGEYPEAIEYYQQALSILREIGDRSGEGTTLNSLGLVYDNLGEYPEAIEYYQQALSIQREIGNPSGEGTTLNSLGLVYNNLGQYPKAIEYYQQALSIQREIGNRSGEGTTLNNLGLVYYNLGQYAQTIEHYQQALSILREVGNHSVEGTTLNNLGAVYDKLGQSPKAIEYYQQALSIVREVNNRYMESITLSNLGLVYNELEQYPKAIEHYQQSLSIQQEIGNRAGEGTTLNNLGLVYSNLEQYPKAIEHYQQSLSIQQEIGNRAGESATLNSLGLVYDNLGQYPKAIEYYQQALSIVREIGNRSGEGTTLNNLGGVYLYLEQYAQAEQHLYNAILVWESLRSSELSDADKISIFETQSVTYRHLQRTLIAQNKIETALEISERGRARAFVELMAQRQQGDSSEEFIPPAPPTLADIQQVARTQNATLVEYAVLEDETLYIWVISPDGNIAFRSVNIAEQTGGVPLEELVDNTRFSMGVRSRSIGVVPRDAIEIVPEEGYIANATSRLQQLHQLLIEPIADLLPQTPEERVIFVPHGELFLVPFPALQDANGTQLIDKHTILTAPAIQVLQLAHRPNPPAPFPSREGGESPSPPPPSPLLQGGGTSRRGFLLGGVGEGSDVLVVGNPVMPSISLNPGDPPVQLSSLPGAELEAKEIAQLLGTEPLIGSAATELVVTERMQTASIIHLATHGILDDEGGIGSSIALTPTIGGNPPVVAPTDSDGFLTAQEILGLNLNAELVVLSACDTGRGKITGDGVVGLSRSLLTAGVSSLVVSLWQVPDAPTAQLMTLFYENLQQGLDKPTALRNAMLTTRETYPEPVNWAAFTLISNK